jgi:group II intron reverse transcriptase/maturase
MATQLERLAELARGNPALRFNALAHHLTPAFLRETWGQMNRRGVGGVDGETIADYEERLDERIGDLHGRLRAGQYKPPPVRRVEIPKGDGRTRLLGIPTVEDRLLQRAVARLLEAVFEQDFLEFSYGFRPRRRAHDALRALRSHLIVGKVMHVVEADIRGCFDRIHHGWLRQMLALRIADPQLHRLIGRWLRAGVMVNGVVEDRQTGTPQGGPLSPLLANVFLHYTLDLWFERVFRRQCRGEAYLVRYADDFVACFQFGADAKEFEYVLAERMRKFSLELAPEKTRRLTFGRFARERLSAEGKRPQSFDFLGFTHVYGVDRRGKFALVRLPRQKSLRGFRNRVRDWLNAHMHWRVKDQQRKLRQMLQGFFQYFALPHCGPRLGKLQGDVQRCWRRTLRRRGQRSVTHWSVLRQQSWFSLPGPLLLHPDV